MRIELFSIYAMKRFILMEECLLPSKHFYDSERTWLSVAIRQKKSASGGMGAVTVGPWTMRPWMMHPWMIHPWDYASLGWCIPWMMHPLDDASLGRCIPSGTDYPCLSFFLFCSQCPWKSGTFRPVFLNNHFGLNVPEFLGLVVQVLD
jgi:hypothetical protein